MQLPEQSKKRLLQLARLLPELADSVVTSVYLQKLTGWTAATIRKDISYILNTVRSKDIPEVKNPRGASNGYKRLELLEAIQTRFFSYTSGEKKKCCIIGLGHFGQALMESSLLDGVSFVIAAGFDASLNRVETLNAPFPLYRLSQLERIIASENIRYAVLSADTPDVRSLAARLARCGIKGIVNYSAAILIPAQNIKIENLSLAISLQNLAFE